nr:TRAV20 [Sphenodon punctatus]
MYLPLVSALLILLNFNSLGRAQKIEQPESATALDGMSYNLTCSLSSVTTEKLQWYRQFPGQGLQYIAGAFPGRHDESTHPRSTLYFQKDKTSNALVLHHVTQADSAVYFCALTDRNNNYGKFIFGSGTRLIVLPNLQKSEPSVYELESTNKSHPLSACLFTDYFPGNINVSATGSDLVGIESSVVVVEDQASYGAVLWQNANENLQCIANYDGEDIQAKKDIADSCSGTQMSFQTDERLNLLSLTVLGLRVIFFKSVAVNLLLTFRLWSR